ncbi:MAG: hypothetical protein Q9168_007946 [Polycauliona sp. 1 TL-2023]
MASQTPAIVMDNGTGFSKLGMVPFSTWPFAPAAILTGTQVSPAMTLPPSSFLQLLQQEAESAAVVEVQDKDDQLLPTSHHISQEAVDQAELWQPRGGPRIWTFPLGTRR